MIAFLTFFNKLASLFEAGLQLYARWQERQRLNQSRREGANEVKLDEIARAQKVNKQTKEAENAVNEVEPASHVDVRDRLRNGRL